MYKTATSREFKDGYPKGDSQGAILPDRSTSSASCSPRHRKMNVAVLQFCATPDRQANFDICAKLILSVVERKAQLICLPECFHFIGDGEKKSLDICEDIESCEYIKKYQEIAKEHQVCLSLGGFQEKGPEYGEGKVYNTHIIIAPTGAISSKYRKIHLFDYPAGGLNESDWTTAGSELVVDRCVADFFDNSFVLGPTICYDLRFPGMYQCLKEMGANILLVPSAFTAETGEAHWEVLLRARAIETQSFVIAAAQVGAHHTRRTSYGHSLIISPWGEVLARLGGEDEGGEAAIVEINSAEAQRVRNNMNLDRHSRFSYAQKKTTTYS